VLEDGAVYHTYSTYARGLDGLWGAYQWLDRAPKGRNETGFWWRHHARRVRQGIKADDRCKRSHIMTQPTLPANDRERAPSRAIGAGTLSRQASR
jgi:hypothetical protein